MAANVRDSHDRREALEIEANYKRAAKDAMVVRSREVKPFEFRERLWHEPPELDYRHLDCFEEVHKESKQIEGWSLKSCTDWIDLNVEKELPEKYVNWARSEHYAAFDEEGQFYLELAYELSADLTEMDDEGKGGYNSDPDCSNRDQKAIRELRQLLSRVRRDQRGGRKTLVQAV